MEADPGLPDRSIEAALDLNASRQSSLKMNQPQRITASDFEASQSSNIVMPDNTLPRHITMPSGTSARDGPGAGFIALGTIALVHRTWNENDSPITETTMLGNSQDAAFPGSIITNALKKRWLHLNEMRHEDQSATTRLRVYVLPEDVDRGSRGSLRDFQKTMRWLLDFVDCSVETWRGQHKSDPRPQVYQQLIDQQDESLFYVFNTLESPNPNLETTRVSGYGYHVMSDILEDEIYGLKTPLYPYQRRSIAAMAQRETDPAKICDSRKRRYMDFNGQQFYLDPLEGVLLKDPPLYTEPQGGILAETMGYGKTLICIALILATRGHYPRVPEDRVDHFAHEPREKVGSLLAMAARRTKHEGIPWKPEFRTASKQEHQFENILEELDKYERVYEEPIFTPITPGRSGKREYSNLVTLCSGTLVIVPTNLLLQWQQEISKHVMEDLLDVLVIDSPSNHIPHEHELVKYDVVLLSKARFEQEYRDDDLNQGKSRRGQSRYRSPLTRVRWLRVICDEGHGFAGSSSRTNAMAMLDNMYIERRWVVSGTPSSSLHGVEVNLTTTESSSMEMDGDDDTQVGDNSYSRRQSISKALHARRTPSALEQEAKDLERLRLIVVNFLHLPPWANQRGKDNAKWKRYLSARVSKNGILQTSPLLREVLQTLIVRHRIEDIDRDLQLPGLHTKTVYLDPSYHDKLAINMFGLVLASNFVTSEREDEDYMFHPKNRRKFELLLNNLRQATFHWIGFTEDHVRETLRISAEYLDKNIDKVADEDALMLTEAILNGERALADSSWMAFSKLHEIGVYVEDFPHHARATWALDGRDYNPMLLGTVQARQAQKFVRDRVATTSEDVEAGLAGAGIQAMKAAQDRAEEEKKQSSKTRSIEGESQAIGTIDEPKRKAASVTLAPKSATKPRAPTSNGQHTTLKRKWLPQPDPDSNQTGLHTSTIEKPSPAILQSAVVGFTSAKLSYLVDQLLTHSPSSKSIVFYSHPNTAFFIAEALELIHIRHRIYASTLSIAQRNAYLQLFNTDDSIRVLLMDLKQAGQGLHIASANRVYIVAPIWEDGVQSQAIKRAHRIGQTRDVYVETLVLKGTFEEDLIRRRQEIDNHLHDATDMTATTSVADMTVPMDVDIELDEDKPRSQVTPKKKATARSLLDDRHMVQVLKDVKFLKFTTTEETDIRSRIAWMPSRSPLFSNEATISPAQSRNNLTKHELGSDLSRTFKQSKHNIISRRETPPPTHVKVKDIRSVTFV